MVDTLTEDDISSAFKFSHGRWACLLVFADDLGTFDRAWRLKRNGVVVLYPSRPRNKRVPYPRAAARRAATETKGDPAMWELAGHGTFVVLRGKHDAVVVTRFGNGWCHVTGGIAEWVEKEMLRRC